MIEEALEGERARLVRLCAHISGDAGTAEDLAQETLLEAWRNLDRVYDPSGLPKWLSAIARNVCLRRSRLRGRELSLLALPRAEGPGGAALVEEVADGLDIEVELERGELACLLDKAMALLPAETRAVLVERLIHESPQAEAAARLGLSEGVVAVRLHRGKLALRRLLTTEFIEEAQEFGLVTETDALQETRLWCMVCGRRRLLGKLVPETGFLWLRCPACTREPGASVTISTVPGVIGGVKGYRSAMERLMTWVDEHERPAVARGVTTCPHCGRDTPVRPGAYLEPHSMPFKRLVFTLCHACGGRSDSSLAAYAFAQPEARRFWKRHPRLRMLPERDVEAGGRAAVVSAFESVADGSRLEVITDRDTFRTLGVHGG